MSLPKTVLDAVDLADTDTLVRSIDGFCASRSWDDLLTLRLHCQAAVERGKQLWAVDEHVRYRLALEGPAELAADAVAEGPARWTLGPLTEVVAQNHAWVELDPHLPPGPERVFVAHERAIRGEEIDLLAVDPMILEIPVVLGDWEPRYPVAEYKSDRAEFPSPSVSGMRPLAPIHAPRHESDPAIEALTGLVKPWIEQSSGRADVVVVDGGVAEALGAIGVPGPAVVHIELADALAWLCWAAASGAAHGRRRGAAAGRFETWWTLAAITDLEFPPDLDDFGDVLSDLVFHWWSDGVDEGWRLNLAITDPEIDRTWAITAIDAL
jgi:hypothetical protein